MTPKEWAVLAQAAYSATPDIGQENSAARIVFNHTPDGFILAIPGTNNESCALADVDAIPHDAGPCGWVHKGIWCAFDSIWGDVAKLAPDALVGHSEGAAGAIYLAARLCLIGKAPKIVYAWESPRTSIDANLADIFTKYGVELHLMWHGEDIVPTVPLALPFMGWRHPVALERFGRPFLPFPNITDHMMVNIIADL